MMNYKNTSQYIDYKDYQSSSAIQMVTSTSSPTSLVEYMKTTSLLYESLPINEIRQVLDLDEVKENNKPD